MSAKDCCIMVFGELANDMTCCSLVDKVSDSVFAHLRHMRWR